MNYKLKYLYIWEEKARTENYFSLQVARLRERELQGLGFYTIITQVNENTKQN